jgi:hypothetical protein
VGGPCGWREHAKPSQPVCSRPGWFDKNGDGAKGLGLDGFRTIQIISRIRAASCGNVGRARGADVVKQPMRIVRIGFHLANRVQHRLTTSQCW